jgi:O-antigen ligase/tetratricopeptide (TPR) repeat protein
MGKRSREKKERIQQENTVKYSQKSKLEKIYFFIIQWGTYLALLTPLVTSQNFFYPYVVPKTIFFRILVDIILIAYILLVTVNRSYKPRMNWLSWSVLGFVVVSFVAAIFGEDFIKSFWSSFERMTGLLTFLHLFAFFLILTSVFRERKHWEKIMTISILIGMVLTLQVFTSNDPTTRGGGSLGNTSFMSAYILFNIFFAIILFFIKKGIGKVFYGVTLVTMLFLLLNPPEQPTQGAIGAFVGGIFLFTLLYFLFRTILSGKKQVKRIIVFSVLALFLVGVAFTQTGFFKEKISEISQSSSWEAREVVWTMAYEIWQERPWLGWGEDNFTIAFTKYYEPSLPLTNDIWYDRAHNIVFDVLVSSGIIGLLSYLGIFIASAVGLLKLCFRLSDKRNIILPLGAISLLAVYFAQNIWVFDMVSSYMMFFLTLSFVYFLTQSNAGERLPEASGEAKSQSVFAPGLLIVVVLISIYWGNIKPALASHYILEARYMSLEKSINTFEKAIGTSPVALYEGAEQFTTYLSEFVFTEDVDKSILLLGFDKAEVAMKKAIEASPNNFRSRLMLGKMYNSFYNVNNDQQLLILAKETLEHAKDLSPENQQVYWELSQNELYGGNKEKSIEYMQKAIDLEPGYHMSYWYMGLIYRVMGDNELAWENMKAARGRGFNWNLYLNDIVKVISVNQALGNYEELIPLYETALNFDSKNAKLFGGLAVSYANLGYFQKASEMASMAVELDPTLEENLKEIIDLWN